MRLRVLVALAGACLAATGCTRLMVPPEPEPIPRPVVDVAPPSFEKAPPAVDRPADPSSSPDPILDSPWVGHSLFAAEVDRFVDVWTRREGEWFPVYLQRMTAYGELVDEALARRGLPRSLRYLPLIESGYAPGAVSRASAVGLWQLMEPTARASGMRVGALVDERRDPVRSTDVALDYLAYLHDRFDSWFLALAAYNGGPTRVERLLDRHAPGGRRHDGLFWLIRDELPRETRDFIPRFVAAARVAQDPGAHGLATRTPRPPFEYDEVSVPDATSLDVVARAAGVTELEVQLLNPQILRRVTPDRTPTTLRVPEGTAARFNLEYARIPRHERVTVTEHVVARGETLWGIARYYGIGLTVLEEANPSVSAERLRPGDRLVVPLLPDPRRTAGGD